MGDLVSVVTLVALAAVVLREYLAQQREDRADRESMASFDAFREELDR